MTPLDQKLDELNAAIIDFEQALVSQCSGVRLDLQIDTGEHLLFTKIQGQWRLAWQVNTGPTAGELIPLTSVPRAIRLRAVACFARLLTTLDPTVEAEIEKVNQAIQQVRDAIYLAQKGKAR